MYVFRSVTLLIMVCVGCVNPLYADPEVVLRSMVSGRNALHDRDFIEAVDLFESAKQQLDWGGVDSERTRRALSLWYSEEHKDFLGEPYERVMVFYYRGMLYLMDRDYQSARACFKAGLLHDEIAEEQQHRADFALLYFLQGWCSRQLWEKRGRSNSFDNKELSEHAFSKCAAIQPQFSSPSLNAKKLFVIEAGDAPRKIGDGIGQHILKIKPPRTRFGARVEFIGIGAKASNASLLTEDISWQAMTRGGRYVDKFIGQKVYFRDQVNVVSNTASPVETTASGVGEVVRNLGESSEKLESVAAALAVVDSGAKWLRSRVKVKADLRSWNNLPEKVFVYTGEITDQAIIQLDTRLGKVELETIYDSEELFWGLCRSRAEHNVK